MLLAHQICLSLDGVHCTQYITLLTKYEPPSAAIGSQVGF